MDTGLAQFEKKQKGQRMRFLAVLLIAANVSGCTVAMLQARDVQEMTPEQIRAYTEAGQRVNGCIGIGGPPPIGGTAWIISSREQRVTLRYGPSCALLEAIIN